MQPIEELINCLNEYDCNIIKSYEVGDGQTVLHLGSFYFINRKCLNSVNKALSDYNERNDKKVILINITKGSKLINFNTTINVKFK